jgi:DNA polymerase
MESLEQIAARAQSCTDCRLCETRTQVVFGSGPVEARLMLVGEAPGRDEDISGQPFTGRSGRLLNQLLEQAEISRSSIYIANIVKCRPPENRNPMADEIDACSDWLRLQIESVRPEVIAPLGNFATRRLTGTKEGITAVHGRVREEDVAGRRVRIWPLFHPAAALRSKATREFLRSDLESLAALLEELRG